MRLAIPQAILYLMLLATFATAAQTSGAQTPAETPVPGTIQPPAAQNQPAPMPKAPLAAEPPAPTAKALQTRPSQTAAQSAEALRISRLPLVNGIPYDKPSNHDLFLYYLSDTYLLNGQIRTTVRTLYNEAQDGPPGWGTDFPGFMQRFASNEAITAINGTVRLGMEFTFHEDLRYLPCLHCTWKRKFANALLSEITARHGEDGRRFFSLTPAISDFSGPIVAHSLWYPDGFNPFDGVIAVRTVAAIRVGQHLAQEFWIDRHHKHAPK
jgi:hypothetical protein